MFALATNPSVVVPTSLIAEHLRYPHFAVNAAALLCLRKRPDAAARALFLDYYQSSSTQAMRIRAHNTLETAWEWSYGEHKFLTRALIAVAGSIADPADPAFAEILLNVWASPEYPGMTSLAARELLSYYSTCAPEAAQWIEIRLASLSKEHGIAFSGANRVLSAIKQLSSLYSLGES